MKKTHSPVHGMTLSELLVSLMSLGIILSVTVALFAAGEKYFHISSNRVDIQTSTQLAIDEISKDAAESNLNGIGIDATGPNPYALLLVSARDSNNVYHGLTGGVPQVVWQKWVLYSLIAQSGGTFSLVRQAGIPAGMPALGSSNFPVIPLNFLALFRSSNLPKKLIASDIQNFTVAPNFGTTWPLGLNLRIISSKTYAGQASMIEPGTPNGGIGNGPPFNGYVEIPVYNQ